MRITVATMGTVSLDRPSQGRAAHVLTPDEFSRRVADALGLDAAALSPDARLIADLGLDSLQMLELVLLLDALRASLEAEDLARVCRIGDVYRLYVERRTLSHHSELACEGTPTPWPGDAGLPHRGGALPRSRRTRQRPVEPGDYAYLGELACRDGGDVLRTKRALAVSPEHFAAVLWEGVLAQHVIRDAVTNAPVGLVRAYDADPSDGFAHVGLVLDRRVRLRGWPLEAAAQFVNYLFRNWPLRKLYARVRAPSMAALASGLGRIFVEEGRLTAHEYVDGAWVDVHILALSRDRWLAESMLLLGRIVGASVTRLQPGAPTSS
jgi:acyl carrier protein